MPIILILVSLLRKTKVPFIFYYMKNLYLLLLLLFVSQSFTAQTKILFEYDAAGNQIKRTLCINCNTATGKTAKKIDDLKTEDLQKFSPNDVISYYPNPVQEQLYLKWDLTDNIKVASIQIVSLNGQSMQTIAKLESKNNHTLSFQPYPRGVYMLLLVYTNGEQKTIKIIKQ
jgi:hypothetical protein